ncbi:DUF423 domain-containing protein [Candidatus Cyanaurora vandensis]|uniref:DUF423 domain-containing protein n=1 Tax=Candidatus Cyanaurora vandensis TaxID=2714958 RepID=UPI00257EA41C|nr:DUF423 domain-containing protein [Candidatus Cyanaurora vandensis]
MQRTLGVWGAGLGLLAVAAGAFGSHLLRDSLDVARLEIFQTAARYQMYHALALLLVANLGEAWSRRWTNWAGWCFVGGTVIFAGSLYGLSLTGIRVLGAITPLGGLLLMAGWGLLMLAGLQKSA